MKFTIKDVEALKPCEERLDNAKKHYSKTKVTPKQFLKLKYLTYDDKIWVAFRLMPKENIRLAAADIAESVLHLFEAKYQNDLRPRKAIEEARKDIAPSNKTYSDAANVVDAAYDSANTASYAAAYAAYAAANAADAAYAAHASYAAAAYSAYVAAYTAYVAAYAAGGKRNQERLNFDIILKYWR